MPTTTPRNLAPRGASWQLLLLIAVVMLAHWAVLRAAPLALGSYESHDTATNWVFTTHTITHTLAQPTDSTVPQTRKAAPPTTTSTRAKAPARATTVPTQGLPQSQDINRAVALENTEYVAIENVAFDDAISAPPSDEPTQIAAAALPDRPTEARGEVTPSAIAKPPPVKAVRGYAFPAPARLKYDIKGEVKGFPYQVNGELLWTHDGKTYDARMEISHFLLGSRVQTSHGQLSSRGLEPIRFGDKVRSEVAAHFLREKNKIVFSANTPDAPLLPGAQDQLSVFMQIAAMLGADPNGFPKGSTLPFQAVGPRSSESWLFTVGDSEKLLLPGGEINAVRLWRDPDGAYDPKVEIWLAPGIGYLPVRIRLTQSNGDFVDQQWRATQNP